MQTEYEPYLCVQCNLSFKMTKDLKTHMLQHDGKKSNSCNQCGYSTTSASKLKTHMLVHSGEKPFVCKQCNYSCTQAGSLKTHMLIHSGEKHSAAHSVINRAHAGNLKQHMMSWCFIWEKASGVYSVIILAEKLNTKRCTCSHIQAKTLSVAHSATIPS